MRLLGRCVLCVALLFCFGCVVPSLAPLYSAETLVYDPGLIGTWVDNEGGPTYTFGPLNDEAYFLERKDREGQEGSFTCHMVELGGKRYLDVYPADPENSVPGYVMWEFLPVHSFFMIEQANAPGSVGTSQLRITTLNPGKLREYADTRPGAVSLGSLDLGDGDELPVFTGTTAELQELIPKLAEMDDMFYGETVLVRQP